jgi:hypothetical protein
MQKVITERSSVNRVVTRRTLVAGWALVVVGVIPLLIFIVVLVAAMLLTTDFADGSTFNLDIYSGLSVLIGTPSLIALLVGVGKIKQYRQYQRSNS